MGQSCRLAQCLWVSPADKPTGYGSVLQTSPLPLGQPCRQALCLWVSPADKHIASGSALQTSPMPDECQPCRLAHCLKVSPADKPFASGSALQTIPLPLQGRNIHFKIWLSENDQDSKTGRPKTFVVCLKCFSFAGQ